MYHEPNTSTSLLDYYTRNQKLTIDQVYNRKEGLVTPSNHRSVIHLTLPPKERKLD